MLVSFSAYVMCDIVKNDRLTYCFSLCSDRAQTITLVKISSHWSKKKKSIFINQTVIVYVLNDST